ncbi:type I DNA topoisomerase [Alitiscatomonas aceti]|uniref:DNA topoisomerase 1 n=1 Tax=Alitiscatomonas aceti TaxID=2981724 RepID=A0ABT2UWB6_9FIRM|nr:type I DNA topoisomerase [Alitiscatomonas aceti]MCU6798932.1 type I DNA topoisomerase [Alitiscatomonas aceti]
MASNLVIVESPAKVKTIKKFLGSSYEVDASGGHVRDFPKSQFGIDVDNDFEPKYITIRGKGEVLARLRKEVKKADKIYLATDPDREGEAISWHLLKALKLDEVKDKKVYRISFNEITKNAVKTSLKEPRAIDMNLVDAQQARRMLDRMVGYSISPILWEKVKRGLSAGRVQSVALRMICDREDEIAAFIPEEYWSLEAGLKAPGARKPMTARFHHDQNGRTEIRSRAEMEEIRSFLEGKKFLVEEIKNGERTKKPPIPFTTSTMQQEASKALNFSTQKTMRVAQQLYEGVDVKGHGTIGLITYLRTDSTRVAEEADKTARAFIEEQYGSQYVSQRESEKKASGKIQDAHEAIRPTNIALTPTQVKESLSRDQFRLYQLIWKRFAASRMAAAVYETTSVKIGAEGVQFTMTASRVKFDGFMSVYMEADDKEEKNQLLAKLEKGQELELVSLEDAQHFTQPPAHYTEASLVKALEEQGIGRPSTYAPTITTILSRRYITKENKNLYVTELGEVVNRIMKQCFPSIVDLTFTANLEFLLDSVGEGNTSWKTVVRNFYPDLCEAVEEAKETLETVHIADEESDELCELCGRRMVIKYGPHGKFLACPGFPECRNTKPYFEKTGIPCPKCGKEVVIKKTKKGRKFYGCEGNPECDFISWQKPSREKCPECGSYMVEKGNKLACSNEQCGFVKNRQDS